MLNPRNKRVCLSAICCFVLALCLPVHGQAVQDTNVSSAEKVEQQLLPGVVVDKVETNSEAEGAGLREGDVLLRWSRGDSRGVFETPVDFAWVQLEQGLRGEVRLDGTRGEEQRSWLLNAETWNVKTRLNFLPKQLTEFHEAKKLLQLGKPQEAYDRWYNTARQLPKSSARSSLLLYAAHALYDVAQWEQADIAFRQSLENAVQNSRLELFIYWHWSESFWARNDMAKAAEYCQAAMQHAEGPIGTNLTNAFVMRLCLSIAYSRGDLDTAEKYGKFVLTTWEQIAPGSDGSLGNLLMLGNIAVLRGDLAKAEDHYRDGLRRRTKGSGSFVLAGLLGGLGAVAFNRGDLRKAEHYYQQALKILERDLPTFYQPLARTYNHLSFVAEARGDLEKAEEYVQKAWSLEERHPANPYFADTVSRLGNLRRRQGDLVQAKQYLEQSLAVRAKVLPDSLDLAWSLNDLGEVAHDSGNLAAAEGYHRQALSIRERLAPNSIDHANTLASLAEIMRKMQRPDDAALLYAKAIDALESQTARLGGSNDLRSGFRAKHLSVYRDYIDHLIARNNVPLAFSVLERARARSLLELLSTAHVDVRSGAGLALLDRERSLRADINVQSGRRIQLMSEKNSDAALKAAEKEIADLLAQYQDVEAQVRANSPAYAALTQPQPLTAKEVQAQLLDPNTLLLEYSLGEERSYVFAVTPDSLQAFELPKREVVEKAARHAYNLLTARNRTVQGESPAQRQMRSARAEIEYAKAAAALSQMILRPVAEHLAGQFKDKRLLIVSDGALAYIPFSALPEPAAAHIERSPASPKTAGTVSSASAVPLVVNHEIVNLPSASVLAVLRQQEMNRKSAPRAVAVLADPVFDRHDPRVASTTASRSIGGPAGLRSANIPSATHDLWLNTPFSEGMLTRSAADVGLSRNGELSLPRLRYTRREAQEILAVTPEGAGKEAVDFEASRSTAVSPELSQYRIVHFATHGLLDSVHPELSGLVFSMVDKSGKPQNGFLELQDIYNLNLPADLVVLSACETGLGKEISGEGLVGLTRGFMHAGASRVVASLWKVSDVGTATLMGGFYRAIEKEGLPPAAALRAAQIEMWKQKRWSDPYYWASFQIQGEWK